jgi:hypothetical protein
VSKKARKVTTTVKPAAALKPSRQTESRARPLSSSARRVFDSIEHIALEHVPVNPLLPAGVKELGFAQLLRKAREIVLADQTGSAAVDGFSSTTPANGSPGGGSGGNATSPTEAAVLRLDLEVVRRRDRVEELAGQVDTHVASLDKALHRLRSIVCEWELLRDVSAVDEPPQCYVASAIGELPWDEAWQPFTNTRFEGVLDEPFSVERPVCRWVYKFTRKHRRLPTPAEMLEYLERGVVRVQTGEATSTRRPRKVDVEPLRADRLVPLRREHGATVETERVDLIGAGQAEDA